MICVPVATSGTEQHLVKTEAENLDDPPRREPFPAHPVVVDGLFLEDQDVEPAARESRGKHAATDPCADDDHVMLSRKFGRLTQVQATPIRETRAKGGSAGLARRPESSATLLRSARSAKGR
jgi:hypothetical protein